MSKIGKQPVKIPAGVAITIDGGEVVVKGAQHERRITVPRGVNPILESDAIRFELIASGKQARSNWGTLRALVNNAVSGLTKPFEKTLILEGIGFRVTKEGNNLLLNLGFSHPVRYSLPAEIVCEIEKNSIVKIKGPDKFLVGQVAAEIRALKKPEPYKGKGFRYSDEVIKRKAGKKAATTAGAA